MACIDSARIATCVVAAAIAGTAAAAFPSVARADDGPGGSPSDLAAATAAVDAAMALADGTAVLPDDPSVVVGPDDPAPVSETPSGDPGGAGGADAGATDTGVYPGAGDGGSQSSTGDSGGENADTIGDSGDTTADTGAAADGGASAGATQPAVAVQVSPSNLNVSVRVASPGDSAPVTQVNQVNAAAVVEASDAAGSGAAASVASSGSVPTAPSGAPTGASTGGAPAVSPASTVATRTDEPGATWTWQWDCLSAPTMSGMSPTGSSAISAPRNWTWIWNCGDNQDQYRGETATQYQPVNVNVSIRVASPGNDGPVSQSNVVVAVGAVRGGATSDATNRSSAPAPSPAPPAVTVPPLPALPGLSAVPWVGSAPALVPPDVATASPIVEAGGLADLALGAVSSFAGLEELPLPIRAAAGWAVPHLGASSVPSLVIARAVGTRSWIVPGARPAVGTTPGARAYPSLSTAGTLQPAEPQTRGASGPRRAEHAPRWRVATPASPTPETAPFGTSASAPAGGATSGGGLPVFLAIPFLAALLDLARRVALERVTLPSGHRGRVRDTPG